MAQVEKTIGTLSPEDRAEIETLTVRRVAIGQTAEAFGRAVTTMATEQQRDWNAFWQRQRALIPGSDHPGCQVDTATGRLWINVEEEPLSQRQDGLSVDGAGVDGDGIAAVKDRPERRGTTIDRRVAWDGAPRDGLPWDGTAHEGEQRFSRCMDRRGAFMFPPFEGQPAA